MSYSTNYKNATFVYIAYSKQSNLFKVGITKNTSRRIDSINQAKLGMVSDWIYIGFVKLGAGVSGQTETILLKSLRQFKYCATYGNKKTTHSNEVLRCTLSTIMTDCCRYMGRDDYILLRDAVNFRLDFILKDYNLSYSLPSWFSR